MVAVVQTAGDLANWRPHVHALVSRGGWSVDREWVPVAFVDERSAELGAADQADPRGRTAGVPEVQTRVSTVFVIAR
jgi:hypothetical protein